MVSSSSHTGWLTPSHRKGTPRRYRRPWMSSIVSRHKARPAPGTVGICQGRFMYEITLHTLWPNVFFFWFCMTVKTCHVNLGFMRRKWIRSRGLTSNLTDEHVLEAAAIEDAFNHPVSGNRHTLVFLPPQPTDPSLGSGYDHASLSQLFPSRCASCLFFPVTVISESPERRAVPPQWELECEAQLTGDNGATTCCVSVITLLQQLCD